MACFIIAMGAAPQMKLSQSGRDFSAVDPPMAFGSHEAAYEYVLQHTEDAPLKGVRAEILEDLSQ